MNEQRKVERKKMMAFTPVRNLRKNTLLGFLGDLTLRGALMIGEMPVDTDQEITVTIDFPETPEFPARRMMIPARVAWCKRESNEHYYDIGLEFHEVNSQNKMFLESILERYQYHRA